tara:strand:+ start:947 stop:1066 length:120 start_codon:yes stop_codon:yes gene_type:complete
MQPSNNQIWKKSIGRPSFLAFVMPTGVYLTTGQLISGEV